MSIVKDNNIPAAAELRQNAEERLRVKTAELQPPRAEEAMQKLVHDLEVHQIELEMQNEELRRARNAVETALEKYNDLFDFAPVGYLTLDREGVISTVNLAGADLLGIERAGLLGRRFGLFVADEDRLLFADFLGKVFAIQGKEACEVMFTRAGNSPLFALIEALVCKSGEECRVAVIDITEHKRAEEKIERLNSRLVEHAAKLESANIELEAFNYTVSHDLRRPLTVINSYCQLVQELYSSGLDEQCRGYIRGIYNGTLSMNQLIEALLNFSHMGHIELSREMIDLSAVAHEVAMTLRVIEPERQVDFRIVNGIMANADADLMRIVLDNLLGNAWKYTGRCKEAVIEFGMTDIDGVPVYFVRDNGTGIDKADADKLFIPFKRLSGADEIKGFGIGLATVERIIRRHGGKIWAEGETGKGTTFYFTLQPAGSGLKNQAPCDEQEA